jgi:hypothetical protein
MQEDWENILVQWVFEVRTRAAGLTVSPPSKEEQQSEINIIVYEQANTDFDGAILSHLKAWFIRRRSPKKAASS